MRVIIALPYPLRSFISHESLSATVGMVSQEGWISFSLPVMVLSKGDFLDSHSVAVIQSEKSIVQLPAQDEQFRAPLCLSLWGQ